MLQRYSEQALTLMHADIRRSQYIELFSEYFRNWQEGGKNNTANKESNPVKSIPVNKDTGQKFSHSKSAVGSVSETNFFHIIKLMFHIVIITIGTSN